MLLSFAMLVDTRQSTPWVMRQQVSLALNDSVSFLSQHTCTSALTTKVATAVAIVAVVTLHNVMQKSRWSLTPGAAAPSCSRGAAAEPDRVSVGSVPSAFYTLYTNTFAQGLTSSSFRYIGLYCITTPLLPLMTISPSLSFDCRHTRRRADARTSE